MIKLLTSLLLVSSLSLMTFSCSATVNGSSESSMTEITTHSQTVAIKVRGSVMVSGAGDSVKDLPESSEANKITGFKVIATQSGEEVQSLDFLEKDPSIKGELKRFELGFFGIEPEDTKFTFKFTNSNGDEVTSLTEDLSAKAGSLYSITVEAGFNSSGEALDNSVEMALVTEDEYVEGQFLVGAKSEMKESEVESLLKDVGIEVTEIKAGVLNIFTVKFSSPDVPQALILASQIEEFSYVEQNGIVSIQQGFSL